MKKAVTFAGTAVLLAGLAAGCGTSNNSTGGTTSAASNFKVGLVTDTGGLNDHGFNHLADMGLTKAESDLGVKGNVVQSNSASDYVPNLTRFAKSGYNLVIAVGFLMDGAVKQVAKEYPNTKFLIIDDSITGMPNVTSALFKTEQCGYLVGATAGLMEKDKSIPHMNSQNVVGVVGGMPIPPVDSYIAGFEQGVQKTDPGAKVILKYANSFSDTAAGSSLAQSEISSGADIVFQVAGGTGIGVIDAAKQANVYAIGVDSDQNYLAQNTVITSAMKGVDTATYDVIKQTENKKFTAGNQFFDLSNGGVGLGKFNSAVPQSIQNQVSQLAQQIKNGQISVSAQLSK